MLIQAVDLIKKWEGCKLEAYLDGGGVPTIGYGHTKGVKLGDKITQQQADAWLDEEVPEYFFGILSVTNVGLNPNQLAALTSLVYNIVLNAYKNSTLLKLLNEGKILEASNQFERWNKDNGKVVVGLTNRRLDEKRVFNTPVE